MISILVSIMNEKNIDFKFKSCIAILTALVLVSLFVSSASAALSVEVTTDESSYKTGEMINFIANVTDAGIPVSTATVIANMSENTSATPIVTNIAMTYNISTEEWEGNYTPVITDFAGLWDINVSADNVTDNGTGQTSVIVTLHPASAEKSGEVTTDQSS